MKSLAIVFRRIFLLLLITGIAACAGKDKAEATPDNVTEQLRQEILNTVADKDRANKAAALAESLRHVFVDAYEQSKKDIEAFHSLQANYETTDAEFNAFFDGINTRGKERQKRVLAIHEEMKAQLTASEWAKLEDAREDALKVDLKLL